MGRPLEIVVGLVATGMGVLFALIVRFRPEYARWIFFRTFDIDVRLLHYQTLVAGLVASLLVGLTLWYSGGSGGWKWCGILLVTLSIPIAIAGAWIQTFVFLSFWTRVDTQDKPTPLAAYRAQDETLLIKDEKERTAANEKDRRTLADIADRTNLLAGQIQHVHADIVTHIAGNASPLAAQIQRVEADILDQMTEPDAQFTIRYLRVVRSLDVLAPVRDSNPTPLIDLPRGFHLCMSTDSGIARLDSPHSFQFHAVQKSWAKRYQVVPTEYEGPVYLVSGTQAQGQYLPLDLAIRTSVELCLQSLTRLQDEMRLEGFDMRTPGDGEAFRSLGSERTCRYTSEFVYPRAVRLICSFPQHTVDRLYDYFEDFEEWLLTGPGSGVLNLWIPVEIQRHMDVSRWADGGDVNGEIFYPGIFDEDGRSGCGRSLSPGAVRRCFQELRTDFQSAWSADPELRRAGANVFAEPPTPGGWAESYTTEVMNQISPTAFLSVGDQCRMVGRRGEGGAQAEEHEPRFWRTAFLEVLPIILMAMHCKKAICFDWLYRVVLMDRQKLRDHREQLVERLNAVCGH